MPKRTLEFFVCDVLICINKIERYTQNIKYSDDFLFEDLIYSATTRELQIIGDAINIILNQAKSITPQLRQTWRMVVDFRNFIVHEYFGLNLERVYDIVFTEIPKLENDVIDFAKNHTDKEALFIAFQDAKADAKMCKNIDVLGYLEKTERMIFSS